ncbi:MAG TPA: Ni/Fe hydrogenase subunit alpha [Acidimicrobiia bacterium]|nr:Ni/Fe hydrogenase subunit alpha [Acidimicrobiia bacterium]
MDGDKADGQSSNRIVIDPVTRIEGHSKITISLGEDGAVAGARFHVTQFRGFERICIGRPMHEMPGIMARICGICPVSHIIASSKACDEIMAVSPPPVAVELRRVINLAQVVQSHALSFFHLSSPDLLFGFDAPPATRNLFAAAGEAPQLARDGIALRRFGQSIIETLGGKRIHPGWVVPGGVSHPLAASQRDAILAAVPEALAAIRRGLDWYRGRLAGFAAEAECFGTSETLSMGLVHDDGNAAYSDGDLRVVDASGAVLADRIDPRPYWEYLGEVAHPDTYLKSTYWKALGYPAGTYRVGPLARLNVVDRLGSAEADERLGEYRERVGRTPQSSFHYHEARLIEILHAITVIGEILASPDVLDRHVRSVAEVNRSEGVGVSEAPRGTLMHHYQVDEQGLVTWVNLVIATGHNNEAMNAAVAQVAARYVDADRLTEGMLNRVEAAIRCFDPCLSCSTHALGQMPLSVELCAADGTVLDRAVRP